MSHAKRIEVNIDGMKFYVMGNDNEKYIKDLAADLDEKIKETARTNYKLNQVQTLLHDFLFVISGACQVILVRLHLFKVI